MSKQIAEQLEREIEKEYTVPTRWVHWLRFISIIALTVTGFYIASVFVAPSISSEPNLFFNARMRMWHEIFGFVLIGVTIFKIYTFFTDRSNPQKLEIVSVKDVFSLKVWVEQIKFYLFLGPHPKLRGIYNPLQFLAYAGLYVLLVVICLTGLVLYVHNYHNGLGGVLYGAMRPLELLFGGLAYTRLIHHLAMWAILIFAVGHLYMVIFNSIKVREGGLDSIVSGLKFKKKH
ncbi:Ni/Fe-hydrogenase, b-type cytochrome subunit [Campylobacterota bacterium]|nr:Ni/Fe-hydrogenase, b-type cytochrome subunit [Campylobacterota bacterium]